MIVKNVKHVVFDFYTLEVKYKRTCSFEIHETSRKHNSYKLEADQENFTFPVVSDISLSGTEDCGSYLQERCRDKETQKDTYKYSHPMKHYGQLRGRGRGVVEASKKRPFSMTRVCCLKNQVCFRRIMFFFFFEELSLHFKELICIQEIN